MRNLKKYLCLALAVAMALSLVVLPTAQAANLTTFSDASTIADENKEAVDVLIAIGMVKGDVIDGKTVIDPQGSYTRAQAATLVARYVLGTAIADGLSDAVTPFDDLEPGYYANGEINYCKTQGIINGLGDGTYNPSGAVTAVAMLKMLLAASGYGQNSEFVGPSWDVNTIRQAVDTGIVNRNTADDLSAPAKREQVFKYTFDALTVVSLVDYNQFLGYVPRGSGLGMFVQQNVTRVTQGEELFGLSEIKTTDSFGLPARSWKVGALALTLSQTSYPKGNVIAKFNAGSTTKGGLYAKGNWNEIDTRILNDSANEAFRIVRNKHETSVDKGHMFYNATTNASGWLMKVDDYYTTAFTNPGSAVTLIDEDYNGTIDIISIRDEFLAKVTAPSAGYGASAAVYVAGANAGTVDTIPVTKTVTIPQSKSTGLVKDDFVWVMPPYDGSEYVINTNTTILDAGKAEIATGVVKSAAGGEKVSSLTLTSGKVITAAANTFVNMTIVKNSISTSESNFYLSSNGYMLGMAQAESTNAADLNYLYLASFAATSPVQQALNPTAAGGQAFFADGSVKTIRLGLTGSGSNEKFTINGGVDVSTVVANADKTADAGGYKGKWYSYNLNSDGTTYTLKPYNEDFVKPGDIKLEASGPDVTLNPGPGETKLLANTSTVLILNGSTYTGFQAFPRTTDGKLYKNEGNYGKAGLETNDTDYRGLVVTTTSGGTTAARIYIVQLVGVSAGAANVSIITKASDRMPGIGTVGGYEFTIQYWDKTDNTQKSTTIPVEAVSAAVDGLVPNPYVPTTAGNMFRDWKVTGSANDLDSIKTVTEGTVVASANGYARIVVTSIPDGKSTVDITYNVNNIVSWDFTAGAPGAGGAKMSATPITLGQKVLIVHSTGDGTAANPYVASAIAVNYGGQGAPMDINDPANGLRGIPGTGLASLMATGAASPAKAIEKDDHMTSIDDLKDDLSGTRVALVGGSYGSNSTVSNAYIEVPDEKWTTTSTFDGKAGKVTFTAELNWADVTIKGTNAAAWTKPTTGTFKVTVTIDVKVAQTEVPPEVKANAEIADALSQIEGYKAREWYGSVISFWPFAWYNIPGGANTPANQNAAKTAVETVLADRTNAFPDMPNVQLTVVEDAWTAPTTEAAGSYTFKVKIEKNPGIAQTSTLVTIPVAKLTAE